MAIAGPKLEIPEFAGFWTAFLLSVPCSCGPKCFDYSHIFANHDLVLVSKKYRINQVVV